MFGVQIYLSINFLLSFFWVNADDDLSVRM